MAIDQLGSTIRLHCIYWEEALLYQRNVNSKFCIYVNF